MTKTQKFANTFVLGTAAMAFVALTASHTIAADTYAEYETKADLGIITQMPGKSAKKAQPRKVNHARYEVMAEKGIFLQPKKNKPTPSQLAKRLNHAEYDVQNDIDG